MNRNALIAATVLGLLTIFAGGAALYTKLAPSKPGEVLTVQDDALVRRHSPIMGPLNAPVTVVEFFDPACETCRAVYPAVKQILAMYPQDVRVVLRYAAFHDGSDQVLRLLEAARLQDKFMPVLESLLQTQPQWAVHGAPKIELAWQAAEAAGLDIGRARLDAAKPAITAVLEQDAADVKAGNVTRTPTFLVNGKPLTVLNLRQLVDMINAEVSRAKGGK